MPFSDFLGLLLDLQFLQIRFEICVSAVCHEADCKRNHALAGTMHGELVLLPTHRVFALQLAI